ncbi:MAG: VOC family protein [Ruminococcus sp.]|nr:VOC family protein [Ruminococcus sp.]
MKEERKLQIVPTLNLGGNCREAIHMYEKAFNGKISCLITYGEANDPEYTPLLKEDQKDYIYHSELVLGGQRIIMSDLVEGDIEFQICYSNFLTVMFDTKEEVQQAYEIMKEGSKTIYQMEATPYSSCRVVFIDKFGIRWGIMTEQTER